MNKYLMLSAAEFLANTNAHAPGTHSFTFVSANGQSYCDGGTIIENSKSVGTFEHVDCSGRIDPTNSDFPGNLKVSKKAVGFSDNQELNQYGIFSEYAAFVLPAKIKTGSLWELWIGLGGTRAFSASQGAINVTEAPKHNGGTSTTASLKQLIALHRQSQASRR